MCAVGSVNPGFWGENWDGFRKKQQSDHKIDLNLLQRV